MLYSLFFLKAESVTGLLFDDTKILNVYFYMALYIWEVFIYGRKLLTLF